MRHSLKILIACAMIASSVAAMAQKSAKLIHGGIGVQPIQIAKAVVHVGTDGKLHYERVGNWIPYSKGNVGIQESMNVAHDTFEGVDDGSGGLMPGEIAAYGAPCNTGVGQTPDSRWFFGPTWTQGWSYDDMPYTAASKGKQSDHVAVAWYQANSAVYDLQVAVFTTEDFPQDTAGANAELNGGAYPGIVFSFGPLAAGGYYYSDIDLSGQGLTFQIPNGGQGGVLQSVGDVDSNTNTLYIVGQPMLWGMKSGNPTPQQIGAIWTDYNPSDLIFEDGELLDYTYGVCPDPLGLMIGFYYPDSGTTTETLAPTTNTINLGKLTAGDVTSLKADDGNVMTVCKFIVPSQTSPIIRMTQAYTTTKSNPTNIELDVRAKLVNAGAFKIRGFLHNYTSLSDVQVIVDTTLTLSYATYTGTASGTLTDYVGASNAMQTKIEVQQTGPSTVTAPCVNFELVNLMVTG